MPIPQLLSHTAQLLDACRELGIPVFYTAQPGNQSPKDRALLTDMWGPGLPDDPAATAIHPSVAPQPGETVLTKWRYSAFQRSNLRERLNDQGRDQLIICGVYAHIGCQLSAAEAFMQDVQPFFVADALADFSEEEHLQALNYVVARCGAVMGTAEVVRALHNGPLTRGALRAELATALNLSTDDLDPAADLQDLGLDSIQLMLLLERWQTRGLQVTYGDVAVSPTLDTLWQGLPE